MVDDKLQKRIREAEDEHADETLAAHLAGHSEREKAQAFFILGGIRIADRMASALTSEAMRTLIRFFDERRHEALGFKTAVDFLQTSEFSPMSKHQFYDRKTLLEKEGDVVFNMLNDLGVSVRQRKLLGKGNIEIVDEKVIVHDGDETVEIEITNQTRLLETLTALADANADKSTKLEKQKEKISKHDEKVRELYTEIDKVKAATAADIEQDAHAMAMITLGLSYREVIRTVEEMSVVERQQFQSVDFERIAAWMSDLSMTFERGSDWTTLMPTEAQQSTIQNPQSDDDIIDRALDVSGDNDRELAEKL